MHVLYKHVFMTSPQTFLMFYLYSLYCTMITNNPKLSSYGRFETKVIVIYNWFLRKLILKVYYLIFPSL